MNNQYARVFPLNKCWLPIGKRRMFFLDAFADGAPGRKRGEWRSGKPIDSPAGTRVLFQDYEGNIIGDAVFDRHHQHSKRCSLFFEPDSIRWFDTPLEESLVTAIWPKAWSQSHPGEGEQPEEFQALELVANRVRWFLDAQKLDDWDELVRTEADPISPAPPPRTGMPSDS